MTFKGGNKELDDARRLGIEIAVEAGAIIQSWRHKIVTRFKSDGTEVTQADTEAETHIRKRLEAACAGVPILGEEFGGEAKPALGDQWIVDPLDGTTPFSVGSPMYGTLIALLRDGEPVVGVIHLPALGETISAAAGCGCWLEIDGRPPARVRVSEVVRLQDAFVSTSGFHATELQAIDGVAPYNLTSLIRQARKLRVLGDCVQHALVCRGRIDLAVDAIMQPWDSAALIPCVREAGGCVADMHGSADELVFAGSLVSASSPALLDQALEAMNSSFGRV